MFRNVGALSKLLAVICSILLIAIPTNIVQAQSDAIGQVPTTGWQSSKLSQAVVNDANRATEILLLHSQNGSLTASDLENAATSLQILFDHFQEIGLNAAIQKQILSNQDAFLNLQMSENQIATFQSRLSTNGVTVDTSRIQSFMNPTAEDRQQFLSMVKSVGLYQTELEAVAQLRTRAQNLASSESSSSEQLSRLSPRTTAHLVLVITAACGACFILAGIGLATGCTVTAAACGAGIGVCTVCALGG